MNNRDPSSDTAIPRGFCASLSVAVTRSVAVSMTEIDAEPSLGTYAKGTAAAVAAHAAASVTAKLINPRTALLLASSWKPRERSAMLHDFARAPTGAVSHGEQQPLRRGPRPYARACSVRRRLERRRRGADPAAD